MFEQTVVLGLLAVCSMQDIKTQKIRLNPILVTGILGVIRHMLYQKIQLGNMLLGMGLVTEFHPEQAKRVENAV